MLQDHDSIQLVVPYNRQYEVLPIVSVFEYFFLYLGRLDAQRFCSSFRFSGHNFKVRMGDDVRLTSADD